MAFRTGMLGLGVALLLACLRAEARADSHFAVGMDVGAAAPINSEFFDVGFGTAYVASVAARNWKLDWRVGESYSLYMKNDLGASVDGDMTAHSMSLSRVFGGRLHPQLGVGAALLSSSYASIDEENYVQVIERDGVGLVGSGQIALDLNSRIALVFGARAYWIQWEELSASVIYEASDMGFTEGVEPKTSIPFAGSLGVRLILN